MRTILLLILIFSIESLFAQDHMSETQTFHLGGTLHTRDFLTTLLNNKPTVTDLTEYLAKHEGAMLYHDIMKFNTFQFELQKRDTVAIFGYSPYRIEFINNDTEITYIGL